MREIKRRRNSIQNTQQITKAMKLVATAKLQKAKTKAEETRPFFNKMFDTLGSIINTSSEIEHPYLNVSDEVKNKGYIVITSNRGLAGGYNSNVCKLVINDEKPNKAKILSVGRRGKDFLASKGYEVAAEFNEVVDYPSYKDAQIVGERVLNMFKEGELDEVYISYTAFNSTISQEAKLIRILPVDTSEFDSVSENKEIMNYEPSPEKVFDYIIPQYINSIIFGALRESVASEHGARMTAMDSATNNAADMIDKLSLEYNRARQASITQELSEIVGGAEALK